MAPLHIPADPQRPRIDQAGLLRAVLRTSFCAFIEKTFATLHPGAAYHRNWHLDALAWHLDQVRLGRIKRLILCVPPRSLKSVSASIAFPAFVLGHDPTKQLICVS